MAKYLDYDGLGYLWQKIEEKTKLATKESLRLVITDQLGGGLNDCNFNCGWNINRL